MMSIFVRYLGSPSLHRSLFTLCTVMFLCTMRGGWGAAPVYDLGEVEMVAENTFWSPLRTGQVTVCAEKGGVLVTDVSDAIHLNLLHKLDTEGATSYYGYLGGTTLLSSPLCSTSTSTLSCIWYWDEGRYRGSENAYPFYQGNMHPPSPGIPGLDGAGMMSTASKNYWVQNANVQIYPGTRLERYAMLVSVPTYATPGWVDSSLSTFSYGTAFTNLYYAMCLLERAMPSSSSSSPSSKRTPSSIDNLAPTEDNLPGESEKKENSSENLTQKISIAVAAALVGLLVLCAVTYKVYQKEWCCVADSDSAYAGASRNSSLDVCPSMPQSSKNCLGRRSSLPSNASFRSGNSVTDNERSFHAPARKKNDTRRLSITSRDDDRAARSLGRRAMPLGLRSEDSLASDEMNVFAHGNIVVSPMFGTPQSSSSDPLSGFFSPLCHTGPRSSSSGTRSNDLREDHSDSGPRRRLSRDVSVRFVD